MSKNNHFSKYQDIIFNSLDKYKHSISNKKIICDKTLKKINVKGWEHMPYVLQIQEGINNLFELDFTKKEIQAVFNKAMKKVVDFKKGQFKN